MDSAVEPARSHLRCHGWVRSPHRRRRRQVGARMATWYLRRHCLQWDRCTATRARQGTADAPSSRVARLELIAQISQRVQNGLLLLHVPARMLWTSSSTRTWTPTARMSQSATCSRSTHRCPRVLWCAEASLTWLPGQLQCQSHGPLDAGLAIEHRWVLAAELLHDHCVPCRYRRRWRCRHAGDARIVGQAVENLLRSASAARILLAFYSDNSCAEAAVRWARSVVMPCLRSLFRTERLA